MTSASSSLSATDDQLNVPSPVAPPEPHHRGTSSSLGLHRLDSYDCGLRDPAAIALYQQGSEHKEIMTNLMDFKVSFGFGGGHVRCLLTLIDLFRSMLSWKCSD